MMLLKVGLQKPVYNVFCVYQSSEIIDSLPLSFEISLLVDISHMMFFSKSSIRIRLIM